MPGDASSTGLIAARVRPVYRPQPKKVELSGSTTPAPFTLKPFAGLFNPYPYGCSVLCNHPADCEAKEVVRRAKDTWATEGKALLLPVEMELIRKSLLAGGRIHLEEASGKGSRTVDGSAIVPEELFRKYTDTDSRPLTPTPTLASGPPLSYRPTLDDASTTCNFRERTTLVLDLRANQQDQETETLSWHTLTLEPPPTFRRTQVTISKPASRQLPSTASMNPSLPPEEHPPAIEELSDDSSRNASGDGGSESEEVPMRRRGKKLRKRKCRRGSTYGQQREVRDPPEPVETQVSQVDDGSRAGSARASMGDASVPTTPPPVSPLPISEPRAPSSFIDVRLLKHLARELDADKVEEEFDLKRRLALEEALRVKTEVHPVPRTPRPSSGQPGEIVPRVFSRQSARFEILGSQSLVGLTPLGYLGKHVSPIPERKFLYGRAFKRRYEETPEGERYVLPEGVRPGLREVMGKPLTEEQWERFRQLVGEIKEPLNFRSWCGVCAVCERLFTPLPPYGVDPPLWIERADFKALERRLEDVEVDPRLARLLREIRNA